MNAPKLLSLALIGAVLAGCGDDVTRNVTEVTGGGGGGSADPTVFNFRSEPVSAYVRIGGIGGKIDRMGGPATTTALVQMANTSERDRIRQKFNETEPKDDLTNYAGFYVGQLQRYHFHLAPFFSGLGVPLCSVTGSTEATTDVGKCVTQALANPVIPDVLRLNTSVASDYPNGRKPDDRGVDTLLAIALLDLSSPTCGGLSPGPCTNKTLADSRLVNVQSSTPPSLPTFPYLNNSQLNPPPAADP